MGWGSYNYCTPLITPYYTTNFQVKKSHLFILRPESELETLEATFQGAYNNVLLYRILGDAAPIHNSSGDTLRIEAAMSPSALDEAPAIHKPAKISPTLNVEATPPNMPETRVETNKALEALSDEQIYPLPS